jgi:hypothetical protein
MKDEAMRKKRARKTEYAGRGISDSLEKEKT